MLLGLIAELSLIVVNFFIFSFFVKNIGEEGRKVDALAPESEEGRDKLR
jgi:ABC-type Zn uptake system ZnuABC Zn-binding protein ZnuA